MGVGGGASDELCSTVQIRVTVLSLPFPPAESSEEWELRLGDWTGTIWSVGASPPQEEALNDGKKGCVHF